MTGAEQQAVPVAQEDEAEALRVLADTIGGCAGKFPDSMTHIHVPTAIAAMITFARHRLASLPCKSGEGSEAVRWGLDAEALALLKKAATFLDSAAGEGIELDGIDAMYLVTGLHELVDVDPSNCFHEDAALFLDGKILGTEPENALTPEDAWQDLVEKDDRNSPAEYPEMCLIEYSELVDYMTRSFPAPALPDATQTREAEGDAVKFVQDWLMNADYDPTQFDKDFAAAIDARKTLTDAELQTAAERFCATPLPETVSADLVAIKPMAGRTGTNLMTVTEAKEMLRAALNARGGA